MSKKQRPQPPEYLRGEWGILEGLAEAWWKADLPATLEGALRPFLNFVSRHKHTQIPWRHRWYILLHGKLPYDF